MAERLFDRHAERVHEGALRYLEQKEALREFIGPGGVRLSKDEEYALYQMALNDPQMMFEALQRQQQVRKMPPDQIPKRWVAWIREMQARETTTPLEDTEARLRSQARP